MKNEENIKNLIKKLNDTTSSEMDKRTLDDAFSVLDESKNKSSATGQNIWRTIMKTKIAKLAAAAVIIIGIFLGLHLIGIQLDGATIAFADVVRPILTARTATHKMTINMEGLGIESNNIFEVMVMEPGRMRFNMPDEGVGIFDFEQGKSITLSPESKMAMVIEIRNLPAEMRNQIDYSFFEIRKYIQQALRLLSPLLRRVLLFLFS